MNRTQSLTVVAAVAAAAVGVTLLGGTGGARHVAVAADIAPSTNGIVVDGLGRTSGTPDVLRVTLGVNVKRRDVSSAMSAASSRQAKVRSSLRKHGVAERDLQTSDVSVYPDYDRNGRPDGYRVSETLTAKLRNMAKAGQAITDAVSAGGNEAVVQGVSFSLEDNAALLEQARDAAFADAKAKALRYAELSGRSLGDVQLVSETASPKDQPVRYAYDGAAQLKSPVPIDPGTSDVAVTVTVRWALR
ncbi:MAG TPA: SIMPL domain-containing protein [Mycobacteriales bacterium]|nr:SIMPL domain-containing protein [Mycobacteriales bacterium]